MQATDTREIINVVDIRALKSLENLLIKARDIQSKCEDYNITKVSSKNARFVSDIGALMYVPDHEAIRKPPMSRYAMSQLCNKIGVPIRYLDRCIESGRLDLAESNINSWLSDYNKNLFVREHEGKVRGILSDRYMTLDTPDIIETLLDVIDPSEYITKGAFLTPERFHARVVQEQMLQVDGEDLFAGIQIDSSDVGRSTLLVRFMIFKQVCKNGLCVTKGGGTLFEQRHVGINLDDFRFSFKEAMTRLPLLIEKSVELVKMAQSKTSGYRVDLFSESELKDFTDKIKVRTKLSEESLTKVVSLMTEKYSPTKWGLINSLTEVAQDFTLEKRLEIEKSAGDLFLVA